MSRFIVGIDLGTTNSAIAYCDMSEAGQESESAIHTFPIAQVVGVGEVGDRPVLPSFVYLPAPKEFPATALALPWATESPFLVGSFAREHGAKVPGRLVSSVKSWLSHQGVDPRGKILPVTAPKEVERISPLDASVSYLKHLCSAWNTKFGKDRLEDQEIVLTVPASFDAAARDLTLEAATNAGLAHVTLIEEPQAAFYSWLANQGDAWRKRVKVGDLILVCDVGGGTTDFTLIGVSDDSGDLALTRVAVGEHILLGGDNMDLALAHAVGASLPGGMESLDRLQQVGLAHACRSAKESLFASSKKSSEPVVVLGRGSKVIGGSIKTELKRETLEQVILDGFLPACASTDQPVRPKRAGLAELGLSYAADPAITRHLARFLGRQASSLHADIARVAPSAVLFNGGVFKADRLRERVTQVLSFWSNQTVPALENLDYDLAVSRGAVYYGLTRRGKGVRIHGGVAMSYYVGIETSAPAIPGVPTPIKALCVVPLGMEEGMELDVPGPEIGLIVGEPAEFRFLGSTTRRDDAVGSFVENWSSDDLAELDPIETILAADEKTEAGEIVPIRLHVHVTEVGTLDIWCQSTRDERRWKLQYHVRPTDTD